jgi:hypothetical protein
VGLARLLVDSFGISELHDSLVRSRLLPSTSLILCHTNAPLLLVPHLVHIVEGRKRRLVRILLVLFVVAKLLERLGYVGVEFGFYVLVVELRLGELKVD